MADRLHLLVVHEGDYGWSLTSPQLPGFVYGRQTQQEFQADLPNALAFANAPNIPWVFHVVRRFSTPDGDEYTIRVAQDNFADERSRTAWRLHAVMGTEERKGLMDGPRTALGERAFVCTVPTDTLEWVAQQLDPRGDALEMVVAVDDDMIAGSPLSVSFVPAGDTLGSLADLGLPLSATVQDYFQTVPVKDRVLVPA